VIEIVDSASMNKPPENIVIEQKTEESYKSGDQGSVKVTGDIYTADKKDTYSGVAKKYNMDVKTLKTLNNLKAEPIYEGMELKVTQDVTIRITIKNSTPR